MIGGPAHYSTKGSQVKASPHYTTKKTQPNPTAMKVITATLLLGAVSAVSGKVSSCSDVYVFSPLDRSDRMTNGSHVGVIQPKDRSSNCPHRRGHFTIAAPSLCVDALYRLSSLRYPSQTPRETHLSSWPKSCARDDRSESSVFAGQPVISHVDRCLPHGACFHARRMQTISFALVLPRIFHENKSSTSCADFLFSPRFVSAMSELGHFSLLSTCDPIGIHCFSSKRHCDCDGLGSITCDEFLHPSFCDT